MSHEACFQGVIHEGETHGKIVPINGIESYVATPAGDYRKNVALLIFTDVFGIPLNNNRLLADSFAQNGFYTVMPDILEGDVAPADPSKWKDRSQWFSRHEAEAIVPIVEKVFVGLKEQGIDTFAAVGYCFGAREVVKFLLDKKFKAAAVAHPSRLVYPADLVGKVLRQFAHRIEPAKQEKLADAELPILFNAAEDDEQFGPEQQKLADKLMANKPFYKRTLAKGCSHGFAVRGDLSKPEVKEGKEAAFKSQIDWFKHHL